MSKDILIIDSDKKQCRALNQYCINMGCFNNIVFAHDGVIAANKLNNQKFDVIILEIDIPKLSGIDILLEMSKNKRSINSTTNIISISKVLEKEKLEKIISCGSRNFLIKPFDEASFQEKIIKILKNKPATT